MSSHRDRVVVSGGSASATTDQTLVEIATAYHASARSELIARIERRDSPLFLYLAATATIFGVTFVDIQQRALTLLVVPMLGVGAALVFHQHNTVIGALGIYLGKELPESLRDACGNHPLRSWDESMTLGALRRYIGGRLWSSLYMLAGPQLVALGIAIAELSNSTRNVALLTTAIVMMLATIGIVIDSHQQRIHLLREAAITSGP